MRNLVPDKILERKDKKGFVTPGEIKWLRGPLKELLEIDYKNLSFLSSGKIRTVVNDFNYGNYKNANLIWRIAMLNYWLKSNGTI